MKARLVILASILLVILAFSAIIRAEDVTTTEDPLAGEDNSPEDEEMFLMEVEDTTGNVTATRECGRPKPESLTCPDEDIIFYLYSGPNPERERIDVTDTEWIKKSKFDSNLPTVFLVHGYRGGDSLMPMVVAKDAYIKLGTHNVIMTDWGALAKASCYPQAVGNLKPVAKCAGQVFNYLKDNAGMNPSTITCVGHSLGAHICGIITNHLTEKLDKIIALDPARPLIRRRGNNNRLDDKDAKIVQVIHTNAGFYGLSGRQGTTDFCVNSGRYQPFCKLAKNEQLCSHLEAVCFFAESLHKSHARTGEPCSNRCPIRNFDRVRQIKGSPITMGALMEDIAENSMYCVKAAEAPYCPNAKAEDPTFGDARCCLRFWAQQTSPNSQPKTLRSALAQRLRSLLLLN